MTVHAEDAAAYAAEQHDDLKRIAVALERIAESMAVFVEGEHFVNVKQFGAWITREDRE